MYGGKGKRARVMGALFKSTEKHQIARIQQLSYMRLVSPNKLNFRP